jgi:hypothetical protein
VKTPRKNQPFQTRPERIVSQCVGNNGYLRVDFKHEGRVLRLSVHRLIASAFCPGFKPNFTVNHKNFDRLNNLPENLEWISLVDNSRHQNAHGRGVPKGSAHPASKLTEDQVKKLFVRRFESPVKLAKEFEVSVSLIYKIRQGKRRQANS